MSKLLNLVDEKIAPPNLIGGIITNEQLIDWNLILASEGRELKHAFFLETDASPKEKQNLLSQLLYLSNTVNAYLFRFSPSWKDHEQVSLIRGFYLKTINFLELLIANLGTSEPEFHFNQSISDFQLKAIKPQLNRQYASLKKHLDAAAIDQDLRNLFLKGVFKFIRKKQLTLRDTNYFQTLVTALFQATELDTESLKEILCLYDFNLPEFFTYMINSWQNSLLDIPGLLDQLERIVVVRDTLQNIRGQKSDRLLTCEASLITNLKCFLEEKGQVIKQLLQLRRIVLKDTELSKSSKRLQINLPVAQFGLLIRMLVEKGLLKKENMGEMFTFFAANFYTPQTAFISAESLQKKSSDVEFANAQKMKGHLIGMLNWLNANYNLSNYS